MEVNSNLIFDLGMHRGLDTQHYLAKGFKVIALEAVPSLCKIGEDLNKKSIKSGKLTIVQKALWNRSGETVSFYVNDEHDDWGSLTKGAAEKGVSKSQKIKVETITLIDLLTEHGLPYYLKCDLEGGDAILATQLLESGETPEFVSIEATSADDIAYIRACGYTEFQIINQYMNPYTKAPKPAREGAYSDVHFSHHMSGLFAKELDPEKWIDFSGVMRRFLDWYSLREREVNLGVGWLDIHATKPNKI